LNRPILAYSFRTYLIPIISLNAAIQHVYTVWSQPHTVAVQSTSVISSRLRGAWTAQLWRRHLQSCTNNLTSVSTDHLPHSSWRQSAGTVVQRHCWDALERPSVAVQCQVPCSMQKWPLVRQRMPCGQTLNKKIQAALQALEIQPFTVSLAPVTALDAQTCRPKTTTASEPKLTHRQVRGVMAFCQCHCMLRQS